MTHWQKPGIPINYIEWADGKPRVSSLDGIPFTNFTWGRFGKIIRLYADVCGYCGKEQTGKDLDYAIRVPGSQDRARQSMEEEDIDINTERLICLECQHKEMELAEIDTRQDDLKSQWMEEKYGYLRDEQ